eukprot:TRINITY_DN3729_c0_g1_i2.p1 TRINITY_DN3729_c0_g1~~TRINITY_DN3729_c0_g1_i2.p1  ORF type:complete len:130 (-),score=20.35 TRINITY_DN3729_c0_g1_i2:23-373(-)
MSSPKTRDNYTLGPQIGVSKYGDIYLGTYTNESGVTREVSIKVVKLENYSRLNPGSDIMEFYQLVEASQHENIIGFECYLMSNVDMWAVNELALGFFFCFLFWLDVIEVFVLVDVF